MNRVEQRVKETIRKYNLCNKKEKILVALSGGKDSAVLAYIFKKEGYDISGIHIELGLGKYSEDSLKAVEDLCKNLGIKLYVFPAKKELGKSVLDIIKKKEEKISNCVICGVVKKWLLNKKARELKADKIATGHHMDDEIETFLINLFKGSPQLNTNINPILKPKDKKFVVRIKPLFFVFEREIKEYSGRLKIPYVKEEICPYREKTYRVEARNFLKKITEKEKKNLMKNNLELSRGIVKKEKMRYCGLCGEPSRKTLCKKCLLINKNT
jgi:uncharacterized protein (TIGR00269 family)